MTEDETIAVDATHPTEVPPIVNPVNPDPDPVSDGSVPDHLSIIGRIVALYHKDETAIKAWIEVEEAKHGI